MSFTTTEFRCTMAHFATGVTVVTTVLDDTCYGITVNAFCSVSLNPPLVLVSIEKTTRTHPILSQSHVFAVNILREQQQYLSERFARKDANEGRSFADIRYHRGETHVPLFDDAMAFVECRVVAEYEGGDHTLFLGQVINLHYNEDVDAQGQEVLPLLYFRSHYSSTRSEICLSKSD
jgi:flavin reductase (DIM6/NTAB) family NADH-FMN oxidoreductase RutF